MAPERVDVLVIGGGVCGVLAGYELRQAGFSYRIVEKRDDYGGVWSYRANEYSHLQAHAALYQWHNSYKLDSFPFKKCPGSTVLQTLRRFADENGLRQNTTFQHEVVNIDKGPSAEQRYLVQCKSTVTGKEENFAASSLFICSGILGEQYQTVERSLPDLSTFSGKHMFAGRTDAAKNFLCGDAAKGKDVVILGSGAFGLEAMEAAHRANAGSITLITRPRDRWIVPYSRQFKFIAISHVPFLPRSIKCWLMDNWLSSLYKSCGIQVMAPPSDTQQNFTGQCNDAFFTFPKKGFAKYLVNELQSFSSNFLQLRSGIKLKADILVIAIGHHVQWQPSFLKGLGLNYNDLHNFAFLGKTPYIGAASDWVWFNVPHGPEKQIKSFITALKACKAGHEKAVVEALLPTPFTGCKGESMNPIFKSGLQERRSAYWRTLSAGLSWYQKPWLSFKISAHDTWIWTLSTFMSVYEALSLHAWLK